MKPGIKITLIGAGKAATHIGFALKQAGYIISQVYSRTNASASKLAKLLNTEPVTDLKKLSGKTDLFIVCVKDDAIDELIKKIKFGNTLVVHTSGSTDMNVFKNYAKNYGVFYPLQTLSLSPDLSPLRQKLRVNSERGASMLKNTPLCIEASSKKNKKALEDIAKTISGNIIYLNSEQRQYVHLAAVFACNFTNHMYGIAETILKRHKIPFKILLPLIEETPRKVKAISPREAQTGPAKRNDKKIMAKHIQLLKRDKNLKKIYTLLSKSIGNTV